MGYSHLVLKSQDILVLVALIGKSRSDWDFATLSDSLELSVSSLHRAVRRLTVADLYSADRAIVRVNNAHEFLAHAVRYIAPIQEGPLASGVPTMASAEPLRSKVATFPGDPVDAIRVWPHSSAIARGVSVVPLTPAVPTSALRDPTLHRRLAALDALRGGRARERNLANEWFRAELGLP